MKEGHLQAGIARRMNDIAPFHVMELLTRARQLESEGRDIVHMEVGEPDFPTPRPVIEAAGAFIRGGKVFYTPALGIPALREAMGVRGAALASSAAFAAVHLDVTAALPLFGLAVLLAWQVERTGSLLGCAFVHAVNNATSLLPLFLLRE